jgi:hypothetical protein
MTLILGGIVIIALIAIIAIVGMLFGEVDYHLPRRARRRNLEEP